jgi:hypothetical protein
MTLLLSNYLYKFWHVCCRQLQQILPLVQFEYHSLELEQKHYLCRSYPFWNLCVTRLAGLSIGVVAWHSRKLQPWACRACKTAPVCVHIVFSILDGLPRIHISPSPILAICGKPPMSTILHHGQKNVKHYNNLITIHHTFLHLLPIVKSRGPITHGTHRLTPQKEPMPMPLLFS